MPDGRIFIVALCGGADRPIAALGGRTPRTAQLDRRTSRDLVDDDLEILVTEIAAGVRLDEDVTFRLTGFGRHRGILALSSASLPMSGQISNTDPGFRNVGAFGIPVKVPESRPLPGRAMTDDPAARRTAALVNEFVAKSAKVGGPRRGDRLAKYNQLLRLAEEVPYPSPALR